MYTISNIKENKSQLNEMLNSFNSETKRVKNLLETRKQLVSEVKSNYTRYIQMQIHIAKDESGLENRQLTITPKISFNTQKYDIHTVKALYKLRLFDTLFFTIKSLSNEQERISELIPSIQSIFSLFWVLSGSKKKIESINNANILNEYISKQYEKTITNIEQQLHGIKEEQAFHDFSTNTEEYLDTLNKIKIAEVYIENDPEMPNFSSLNSILNKVDKSIEAIDFCNSLSSKYKEEVIKNANMLLIHEVNQNLQTIDVDEIKRYVKRLSINALKDAGFTSILDLNSCSIWRLSNIRGISENGAREIKKAASIIREETKTITKIKLNQDNKTNQSTNLLQSLYCYDKNLLFSQKTESLNKIYNVKIKNCHNYLKYHPTALDWLQSNHNVKNNIYNASQILLDNETSEYLDETYKLLTQNIDTGEQLDNEEIWNIFNKNSAHYFAILDELCPGLFGNDDFFYGLPEDLAQEIQEECIFPEGLLVTLRRYQEWGVKYILHQKSVLLGDEMGLGKTVQSIATMVSLKNVGARLFLVVCPAAVMINWCREIEQHSKLKAIKIHGSDKKRALKKWLKVGGVGVTTYETTKVFSTEENLHLDFLVVDEAHYVKNPDAQRTKNIIELGKKAERKLYLTGTALENKVDEMVELIKQLNPKVASQIKNLTYLVQAESFKQKIAPVYYRRKREDVLTELPDLIEKDAWCSLKNQEKEIYEDAVLNGKSYPFIRRVSWHIDDLKHSSKAERLMEIIETAQNQHRKIIVFSFFLDTLEKLYNYLGARCLTPITGALSSQKRQEVIDKFNESPDGTVLLGQITAAGTGLNIQSASVVVITEPQFKPSIENQAISRAYRMGQTRNVLVYRLLCENTVDEKIRDLLYNKQQIFDAFADESIAAKANQEIDDKKFKNIIEEEIKRIKKEKGIQ